MMLPPSAPPFTTTSTFAPELKNISSLFTAALVNTTLARPSHPATPYTTTSLLPPAPPAPVNTTSLLPPAPSAPVNNTSLLPPAPPAPVNTTSPPATFNISLLLPRTQATPVNTTSLLPPAPPAPINTTSPAASFNTSLLLPRTQAAPVNTTSPAAPVTTSLSLKAKRSGGGGRRSLSESSEVARQVNELIRSFSVPQTRPHRSTSPAKGLDPLVRRQGPSESTGPPINSGVPQLLQETPGGQDEARVRRQAFQRGWKEVGQPQPPRPPQPSGYKPPSTGKDFLESYKKWDASVPDRTKGSVSEVAPVCLRTQDSRSPGGGCEERQDTGERSVLASLPPTYIPGRDGGRPVLPPHPPRPTPARDVEGGPHTASQWQAASHQDSRLPTAAPAPTPVSVPTPAFTPARGRVENPAPSKSGEGEGGWRGRGRHVEALTSASWQGRFMVEREGAAEEWSGSDESITFVFMTPEEEEGGPPGATLDPHYRSSSDLSLVGLGGEGALGPRGSHSYDVYKSGCGRLARTASLDSISSDLHRLRVARLRSSLQRTCSLEEDVNQELEDILERGRLASPSPPPPVTEPRPIPPLLTPSLTPLTHQPGDDASEDDVFARTPTPPPTFGQASWGDLKSLILGRPVGGAGVLGMAGEASKSSPQLHRRRPHLVLGKKAVSWSDLQGSGALEQELRQARSPLHSPLFLKSIMKKPTLAPIAPTPPIPTPPTPRKSTSPPLPAPRPPMRPAGGVSSCSLTSDDDFEPLPRSNLRQTFALQLPSPPREAATPPLRPARSWSVTSPPGGGVGLTRTYSSPPHRVPPRPHRVSISLGNSLSTEDGSSIGLSQHSTVSRATSSSGVSCSGFSSTGALSTPGLTSPRHDALPFTSPHHDLALPPPWHPAAPQPLSSPPSQGNSPPPPSEGEVPETRGVGVGEVGGAGRGEGEGVNEAWSALTRVVEEAGSLLKTLSQTSLVVPRAAPRPAPHHVLPPLPRHHVREGEGEGQERAVSSVAVQTEWRRPWRRPPQDPSDSPTEDEGHKYPPRLPRPRRRRYTPAPEHSGTRPSRPCYESGRPRWLEESATRTPPTSSSDQDTTPPARWPTAPPPPATEPGVRAGIRARVRSRPGVRAGSGLRVGEGCGAGGGVTYGSEACLAWQRQRLEEECYHLEEQLRLRDRRRELRRRLLGLPHAHPAPTPAPAHSSTSSRDPSPPCCCLSPSPPRPHICPTHRSPYPPAPPFYPSSGWSSASPPCPHPLPRPYTSSLSSLGRGSLTSLASEAEAAPSCPSRWRTDSDSDPAPRWAPRPLARPAPPYLPRY